MKKWTVMVFMAGDNDLEREGHKDLKEMMQVGCGPDLNVVVEFDSRAKGAIRYEVQPNHLQIIGDPLGDSNTGNPAVLTDFIRWARAAYPAEHYLLVIWNHGTGWENLPPDFNWSSVRGGSPGDLKKALFLSTLRKAAKESEGYRAIALDATSRDFLDNQALQQALATALAGEKIDVLGFDACLMGMVEIGYQLRNQAHFMVASQETEPAFGWPYHKILGPLAKNPTMSPRAVSHMIVRVYGEMGRKIRAVTKYTQSAFDLARMETTFSLVRQLAEQLTRTYPHQLSIRQAVHDASGKQGGAKRFKDRNSVDVYDWLQIVARASGDSDAALKADIDALLHHLTPETAGGLIVASAAELGGIPRGGVTRDAGFNLKGAPHDVKKPDNTRVHGASIYLPQRRGYSDLYENLEFARTGWGQFAKKVSETMS
ncbi:MAG: hypothetical protein KDJ65_13635 [Anaerolineae bacterium]|nr:hypothetical protein [Anaerolineae bacterium]